MCVCECVCVATLVDCDDQEQVGEIKLSPGGMPLVLLCLT